MELVRIQCSLEDLKKVVMGAIAVDDQKTTDIPKSSGILIGSSYLPNPRMGVVIEVNVIDVLAVADLTAIPSEICRTAADSDVLNYGFSGDFQSPN